MRKSTVFQCMDHGPGTVRNHATPQLKLVVFAYDFPHKKSQDVVQRLVAVGCRPVAVLAAPPMTLAVPHPSIRVKPRHVGMSDTGDLCRALGIPCQVVEHGGDDCLMELDHLDADIGVIAGARILPRAVIERFRRGIVNLHPGLLPATRGLDALQWAIYRDLPLGVTAHLIDHRVDAGRVLERRVIDEYPDDTLIDLSLRLYETQLGLLPAAIQRATSAPIEALEEIAGGAYDRSFPPELVPQLRVRLRERRRRLRRGYGPALSVAV